MPVPLHRPGSTHSRLKGLLCGALALLLSAHTTSAQGSTSYASIDSQYFAGRPGDVLALCDSALLRDSTNFDLLWRASRAALTLGFLSDRQEPDNPMYLRAEALANVVVRRWPERVDGYYWLAAATGSRALHADIRAAAQLGNETLQSANRALAIDSMHAGAHDVLGKLNSEVRKLPATTRFIAGRLLGISVVRSTSWELAEQHLRRAVELDPTMILYRVDLAEMYLRTDRKADATRLLNDAIAMPRTQPIDAKLQDVARAMLAGR